ncbi:hypothetical protein TNCV_4740061 [Trichonephila clavipes]|nr:hypothetical protein TNCV_4740061 [Trichonephila clavipes]
MLTSSSFDYEIILLSRETDHKWRLPARSMFTKPSVQRHLAQDSQEESSRTLGIPCSVTVRPARRLLFVLFFYSPLHHSSQIRHLCPFICV